jgi:hypothetical protein
MLVGCIAYSNPHARTQQFAQRYGVGALQRVATYLEKIGTVFDGLKWMWV